LLLAVANVSNIGADLGGMAEAMDMMTGINSLWWPPVFAGDAMVGVSGTSISPYLLFPIGLIGTGMLSVPVLAGSSAFAISEAMA
jgi:Mn2+/Fe2+ NRAMP family transporter